MDCHIKSLIYDWLGEGFIVWFVVLIYQAKLNKADTSFFLGASIITLAYKCPQSETFEWALLRTQSPNNFELKSFNSIDVSTDASLLISEWSNSKILASYWCNVQALTNEGRVYGRIRVQLSGIILSSSFLHLKFQTSGYILILEHIPVFFSVVWAW